MIETVEWYRSDSPVPEVRPTLNRRARNWLRGWLPEPDVHGKTIVLYSRRTLPKASRNAVRSRFHGLFSEFHSVLGALAWGQARGAVGVRVDFRSPLYVEPDRGQNWWTYFFDRAVMHLTPGAVDAEEVHLTHVITKYGRYGGFSDVVCGSTPYLYPMTHGLSRVALHRLVSDHVRVRPDIRDEIARFISTRFEPGAYVVGVHYRGTDATHNWTGAFTHYRTSRVSYRPYSEEVRRVLETAAPRVYQVFVATDEIEFLEFMRREFGDRVLDCEESPRARAGGPAVHLDATLPASNYQKGKSALIDCQLLAATDYVVKGRSNLSDASLALNPQLPYSFWPDVPLTR